MLRSHERYGNRAGSGRRPRLQRAPVGRFVGEGDPGTLDAAALAAHQAVAPAQRIDPGITEAIERQNRAMRELSRRAFPETDVVPADAPAPIEQARAQRRRQAAATEAAALRRTRAKRAGATVPSASHPRQEAGEVA